MQKLFVISGPSGCGKTTIARKILGQHEDFVFSVSATTRAKRSSELDGKDYFFVSKDEFENKIQRGDLAEWETIYGDYYGTLKSEIELALKWGKSMLFDIDVNGAISIKKKYPKDAVLIFIQPPNIKILEERLKNRKTETAATTAKRLERVSIELGLANKFDFCVINDSLEKAVQSIEDIIKESLKE